MTLEPSCKGDIGKPGEAQREHNPIVGIPLLRRTTLFPMTHKYLLGLTMISFALSCILTGLIPGHSNRMAAGRLLAWWIICECLLVGLSLVRS